MAIDVFDIKPENQAEFIIQDAANDTIMMRLNNSQTDPSFHQFTSDIKITYFSPGYSRLRFRFTNDANNDDTCGGQRFYTNKNGRIVSNGFPMDNYEHNTDCHWRIWAPVGYGIKLNFNLVYLANKNDCGDRLEIYRGFQVLRKNKRFRNICETRERPLKIRMNFNMVLVRFTTDMIEADHGFMLTYAFYKVPSRDREHKYTLNSERKSIGDPLPQSPFKFPCGCEKNRANQLPVIQNTKEPIGSTYPWLATVKVKHVGELEFNHFDKNIDGSYCSGALISRTRIVVHIECRVQAVHSTVSLGYDIDNLDVPGEFSVVTFIAEQTLKMVDIKPLFAFDWSPCPICLRAGPVSAKSENDVDRENDQTSKVIRRKSRLNKNMVELIETQISNATPGLIITKSSGHTILLGFNNEDALIAA